MLVMSRVFISENGHLMQLYKLNIENDQCNIALVIGNTLKQAKNIVSDATHILQMYNRYKNSFIPTTIEILNKDSMMLVPNYCIGMGYFLIIACHCMYCD